MKTMKKAIIYMMLGIAATGALSSCSDDFAEPPVIKPEGGVGTGEWNNPMTAYQVRLNTINYQMNPAWVKGYIVGVVDTDIATVYNDQSADFLPPFTTESNMLIADDPAPFERLQELKEEGDESGYAALLAEVLPRVATVQLPSNMRGELSPVNNPSILHQQVCLYGTTGENYCGVGGVRSPSDYNLGAEGKEPGEAPEPTPTGAFYENFTASATIASLENNGWRTYETEGNLGGWTVTVTPTNNYVSTDAYNGYSGGGPYEHWLVTPPIKLDELEEKSLEFVSRAMTPTDDTSIEVYAMSTGNPATATLTKLDAHFADVPASGFGEWESSGKLSLGGFSGEIYIGWRYRAERGGIWNSTTWCIDNVNVGNRPEPADWTKATEFYHGLAIDDENGAAGWTFDNVSLTGNISYVWNWRNYNGSYYLNGSAYAGGKNNAALSYAYSQPISLEAYKNVGLSFDHAASFQTTITQLGRVVVREAGTTEWTEYVIPAWPVSGKWVFSTSGIIDISDFAGKTVEVGFKYESTAAGADTWEIRELRLTGIEK